MSRFALVGGYIWYALRDDPPVEEGGRERQGGREQRPEGGGKIRAVRSRGSQKEARAVVMASLWKVHSKVNTL